MVANHARKKQARKLIAESRGKLTYLEAMGYTQRLPALYPKGYPGSGIRGQIKSVIISNLQDGKILEKAIGSEASLHALNSASSTLQGRLKGNGSSPGLLVEIKMELEEPGNSSRVARSKLDSIARTFIDSLDYLGQPAGIYLSVTPREALEPIDRKDQTELALELMEDTEKSYEDSLVRATRLLGLRPTIQKRWRSQIDDPAVLAAKEALESGRDLVILGQAATGKSTAAYSVLGALNARSILVENDSFHLGLVREYLRGLPVSVVAKKAPVGLSDLTMDDASFLVIDEPSFGLSLESVPRSIRKILTVHARTPEDAQKRLALLIPGLRLLDPIFLAARGESDGDGDLTRWLEIDSEGAR